MVFKATLAVRKADVPNSDGPQDTAFGNADIRTIFDVVVFETVDDLSGS